MTKTPSCVPTWVLCIVALSEVHLVIAPSVHLDVAWLTRKGFCVGRAPVAQRIRGRDAEGILEGKGNRAPKTGYLRRPQGGGGRTSCLHMHGTWWFARGVLYVGFWRGKGGFIHAGVCGSLGRMLMWVVSVKTRKDLGSECIVRSMYEGLKKTQRVQAGKVWSARRRR